MGSNDRAGFFATLEGSDFSRSFFVGFDSSSSRRDQSAQALFGVLQFHGFTILRWAMSGSEQADDPAAHDAIGLEEFDHPVKDQTHAHGRDEKPDNARGRVNALRADFF